MADGRAKNGRRPTGKAFTKSLTIKMTTEMFARMQDAAQDEPLAAWLRKLIEENT